MLQTTKPDPEALGRRIDSTTHVSLIASDNKATGVFRNGNNVEIKCKGRRLLIPIPGSILDQPMFPTELEAKQT